MNTPDNNLADFLRERLIDSGTQWTVGSFGAIAEFMRDDGEPVTLAPLSAVTARGGIGFSDLEGVRPFASETAAGRGWSHRVSLCLPEAACAMNRRAVLTELGPDDAALRPEDRRAVLFDMGLDRRQVDVCIRTGDPDLIALLRREAGRPVLEHGNPALMAIVAAGPHRVFITRLGRAEVYQPIPPVDGKSPEGPHTHVLPKLLNTGRTHAANEPVPAGFVPCAHVIPPHPARDGQGRPRPWDEGADAAFRPVLARWGEPSIVALGRRLEAVVLAGEQTSGFDMPDDRFARLAVRAALRRLAARPAVPEILAEWRAAFDRDALLESATGH